MQFPEPNEGPVINRQIKSRMKEKDSKDGREHLTAGLLVSWVSQLLAIASGFLVPRLIDSGMGPVTLGVWDFGWSMVGYFGLLQMGISGSVNRFVALERGKDDLAGVNRVSSSAALLQRGIGGLILLITLVVAWAIPYDLKSVGPELEQQTRWLVFLLGCSMGLSCFGSVFTGVLTGCHNWATHHLIYAVTNILSVIGMVTVLSLGFGIVTLGLVYFSCELSGRILRGIYAYRACPGLRISMKLADKATLRSMAGFGGRMALGRISRIILAQTSSLLILTFLGPAALAMFVRPRALLLQAAVFPQKYSFMLTPTVASMFGSGCREKVNDFVISSSRTGLYLSLPIIVFMATGGVSLMRLWMGYDYANPWLIGLLTFAMASEIIYQPLDNLLIGLNLHGRPALIMLGAAILALLLVWIVLAHGGGLPVVALAIGIPWTFAHGVYLPLYTCRRLGIRPGKFFREVWGGPLLHAIPFGLILAAARVIFHDQPLNSLLSGGIFGGCLIAVSYWFRVLPDSLKRKVFSKIKFTRSGKLESAVP
ncbi:MAG: transporter of NadC family protein [Verrucomicrobiales bacterium]|nr:transporter of NadC family protein [Verrucomicrobiales bacterium]